MNPKVFVSHASEDKERFVLSFAEQLRKNGIDAWLDKWEMLPGDSLVDKIFEEGLREAKAVVVVLSKFSVEKPWVREELNAAVVHRINTGSKLIPIVIDQCEVPQVLKSTVWERIDHLSAYQPSLDRIIASIFGSTDKTPLGSAPAYAKSFVSSIGGLNKMDSLVLKLACEHSLETGIDIVDPEQVYAVAGGTFVVPQSELHDSIEVLDQHGYFAILRTFGGGLSHFRITTAGFDTYANACIVNFQGIGKNVISAIVNMQMVDNQSIATSLKQPAQSGPRKFGQEDKW